ncbi:MAG: PEP-CTERM sorting domain-containing protein [Planctomycetia bacterium]|nr:PEP-CTERM sorting domain-containing protein [Planctomycetia bacterium]
MPAWWTAATAPPCSRSTLNLSGANTYVGGTTLAGGRLELGSAGALGTTGGITFSGGTLVATSSNTADYSARFSQAAAQPYSIDTNGMNVTWATGLSSTGGTLTKTGSGILVLAAANQFAGGISLAGGSLELGATGALGSAGTISFAGGALRYSATDATDYSARFSAAAGQPYAVDTNGRDVTFASALTSAGGSLTKQGAGTLALTAANSYSGDTTITGGTLSIGAGGTSGRLGSGSVSVDAGGLLAFNRTDTYGGAFGNTIFGSGGIRVQQGTLTLSGSNAFGGSTTVTGGTLRATSTQALGGSFAADALALAGGRVDLVSDWAATFGPFGLGIGTTVSANSTLASDRVTAGVGLAQELGTLAMGGQTLTIARGANVTSGIATVSFGSLATFSANPTIVTDSGAEVVFGGGLGGSLTTLTKGGAGLLTLTSTGHSGGYAINAGTLQIGSGGTTGSLAGATGVSVASGATVAFNRTDDYGGPFTTPITGAGGISLAGGTLALDAAYTFAGPTTVAGGMLRVGTGGTTGALSGTSGVSVASGSSLVFDRSDNYGGGFAAPITGAGGISLTGGTLALSGTSSFAGPATVDGGTLRIGTGGTTGALTGTSGISLASGSSLVFDRTDSYGGAFSAPITGAGSVSLTGGTLSLSGSNAFTGGLAVNGGRLVAAAADALGQGNVTVASGALLRLLNSPALGSGNAIAMSPGAAVEYASGVSADLLGSSSLAGWSILPSASRASTASLLFGTVPAAGTTLSAEWMPESSLYSDILSLHGTGAGNTYVLSMTYDPAITPALLTELNIARRPGTSGQFAAIGTSFQGVGTPWTSVFVTPGQYGVDTSTQTVWVVGDANSQFIVVPEPGTLALVAVAAAAAGLAATRRRRG